MEKLISFGKKLISPTALGIVATLAIVGLTFSYYNAKDDIKKDSEHNVILKFLKVFDEKSVDFRLSARGPRPGADQVALLTVDEKAIQTVGRWPWPRETTAKAVDNAVKLGAKVIAFDMVFSEPSTNPALHVFQKLKEKNLLAKGADQDFQSELNTYDSDEKFAQVIEGDASHLVLGSFFDHSFEYSQFSSYADVCHNFIFEKSQSFRIWDHEDYLISYSDPFEAYVPDSMKEVYLAHMNSIEEAIREGNPHPANSVEKTDIEARILDAQLEYCTNWLDASNDELFEPMSESWAQLKSQDEELTQKSFQEWADQIKMKSLSNLMPEATGWVMNTPQISRGSKHTGYFNAQQDMDGTIRRSRLVSRTGKHFFPSIALKAFLLGNNYNAEVTLGENIQNPGTKKIDKLNIINNETGDPVFSVPVDGEGLLKINYAGPQKMFKYVSLADLLTDSEDMEVEQSIIDPATKRLIPDQKIKVKKKEFFKDKYFILGATAIGVFDLRVTPFDENYPGAETHINVLDNLLRQDFLFSHPDEEANMMVVLLVLGLVLSICMAKLGAVSGMLLTASTMAGVLAFERYFLFNRGIVVSVIFPLFLTGFLYVFLTFYKYFTEERNKKELRATFQKYVSPAIVDEVLKNPKNLELGGRKENITVLFSDVRGFTTISEKLDPRALSDLLNSYLTPMTDLVFKNKGTLDKYMGDAVMAFFGAPIHYESHPEWAARCALEMLVKLKELQDDYKAKGLPEIDIGIGLNTGDCSVGNMGSQTVRSYTVMGDSVNLGSRLEGINKEYGTRIIISEFTHARVKDKFICRPIDLVRVKGKVLPVRIYELVAEGSVADNVKQKLDNFIAGYDLFYKREFNQALAFFNKALESAPEDGPAQLYVERCQEYLETPPPADWDGVTVMKTK